RVKLAYAVIDDCQCVGRLIAEGDPNPTVSKSPLDLGPPYQPSGNRRFADPAQSMHRADDCVPRHRLTVEQRSEQWLGQLRPVDVICWRLHARNQDATWRGTDPGNNPRLKSRPDAK